VTTEEDIACDRRQSLDVFDPTERMRLDLCDWDVITYPARPGETPAVLSRWKDIRHHHVPTNLCGLMLHQLSTTASDT